MKKSILFSILILSLGFSQLFAQTKTEVTGTWIMNVETNMGSGSPTFKLEHVDATNLKGTYTGQLGDSVVKGTIKGEVIHLEFEIQGETIEYDGKVKGDQMEGKVKLGSMAEGTFTGKRKGSQ